MSVPADLFGTAPSGWECGNCGAWTPTGLAHTCPTHLLRALTAPPPLDPEERMAAALERIAGALEKRR